MAAPKPLQTTTVFLPPPPISAFAATKYTTPAELAMFTAKRKEAYEAKHPETRHGENLEGAGVAKLATPETPRFTADTAAREAGFPNSPTMRPDDLQLPPCSRAPRPDGRLCDSGRVPLHADTCHSAGTV